MNKAAQNERIKLRATYFNNLSAGLLLGGCLIPYLVFVQKLGDVIEWMRHHPAPLNFGVVEAATAITPVLAFFLALRGAKYFRRAANEEIAKIHD
jgi:hypothetical protein